MTTTKQTLPQEAPTTIPRHKDTLMGFPVVLLSAAYEATHGEETGIVVPDVSALEAAIAVARVTLPYKLSGNEIRFLRKAIGMKAVDLAKFLAVDPAHFSRWENESGSAITTNAERVLRLRVAHALRHKAPGVDVEDDEILDMDFVAARSSIEPVTLMFERLFILKDRQKVPVWHFLGIEAVKEARKRLRVVA
jgi:DNA-binding transcriptional regulator YiaG